MTLVKDMVYSRGFILTDELLPEFHHYVKLELSNGKQLWHDPSVETSIAISPNGLQVVVLGHWALSTEDETMRKEIAETLMQALLDDGSEEEFHEILDQLAGRYAVFTVTARGTSIYNDALGSRTVYYSLETGVVASHLNALLKLSPAVKTSDVPTSKLQWVVDFTNYVDVRQLLPNFVLRVDSCTVERIFPRVSNRFCGWTDDERYEEVIRLINNANSQYFAKFDKVAVSVTGGYDSRISLATLKPYWDRIDCFTYGIPGDDAANTWGKVMQSDFQIVHELIEHSQPKSHRFIDLSKFEKLDRDTAEIVEQNSMVRHGRHLLPVYRELFDGDGWLHIRGNGPEIWRTEYQVDPTFSRIVKLVQDRWEGEVENRLMELGYKDDLHGFNRYNMAYWEFRHGKWLAEIQNETDVAFDTHLTTATRRIAEILLSFPRDLRVNGLVPRELINRCAPELNFTRLNDVRNLYEIWRDRELADFQVRQSGNVSVRKILNSENREVSSIPNSPFVYLPKQYLLEGWKVRGLIKEIDQSGALALRVHNSFANSKAGGSFVWKILVNGEEAFCVDGTKTPLPVNFTIKYLQAGDKVEFEIEALRSMQGFESWERATRTKINCVEFVKQTVNASQELPFQLSCDLAD